MLRASVYLSLIAFLSVIACQPARQTATSKGTGFYQYINDDTTRRNLSPFYSDRPGVMARNGMVASAHPVASQVGVSILKAGGNAIDAAVAVQFALAVVHPAAGNIGGGGFVVYRDKTGQAHTLDFREKAPAAASRNMYLDSGGAVIPDLSFTGHLASGVPGTVDGMVQAHQRFGKLSWETLLEPAIGLAQNGVMLTRKEAAGLNRIKSNLVELNPGKDYLQRATEWKEGDTLIQTHLAQTLRLIRDRKREGFYAGETARLLIEEMQRGGGIMTLQDLKNYRAVWREPIAAPYKNYRIISMPPPSSGGVALVQLLKMVEDYPLKRWGWNNDSTVMVMIEAERRVYADRAKFLGDPDFVKVPVGELISTPYLRERMQDFSFAKASDSQQITGGKISGYESSETTHFSVVDSEGNAVAVTTTLNGSYGSRVFVQGAGFLLNNEMDDFSVKPGVPNAYGLIGAEANAIQPAKRMLSSMTPTIIEKDGALWMVVGTPGGSTIITSVFQTILNVMEHEMTMQQAVNALKFHHQWLPDKTVFEQNAFSPATIRFLQQRGQNLEELNGTIGRMDAILIRKDGSLEGGSDPRGDDASVGY